jgi:diacylglycerol kinase (ATP)
LQHNGAVTPSAHPNPNTTDFLLVNPVAGGNRASQVLPSLRKFAQEQGWQVEIHVAQSADDLAARAQCAASQGYQRLLVLGGDGTFQTLLNAVTDYPHLVLGVIPAGGGNDLAASLGLPENPIRAAALLLQGETCCMDAVRVRTSDGRERLYTGGGGVGLDAEAAHHARGAYRHLRGRFRYLLAAIRALHQFRAIAARITMEPGEPRTLDTTALLVGVLNTPSYGAGLYLAPDAQTDDGSLDLVVLKELTVPEIVAVLPTLWLNGTLKTKQILRFRVDHVRIETEKPYIFHGDGEILGMTPVEISVVRKAFSVLRSARGKS